MRRITRKNTLNQLNRQAPHGLKFHRDGRGNLILANSQGDAILTPCAMTLEQIRFWLDDDDDDANE